MPKELGGTGKGQNPEQLFAMGYSCQYMITQLFSLIHISDSYISSSVSFGSYSHDGWSHGQS